MPRGFTPQAKPISSLEFLLSFFYLSSFFFLYSSLPPKKFSSSLLLMMAFTNIFSYFLLYSCWASLLFLPGSLNEFCSRWEQISSSIFFQNLYLSALVLQFLLLRYLANAQGQFCQIYVVKGLVGWIIMIEFHGQVLRVEEGGREAKFIITCSLPFICL